MIVRPITEKDYALLLALDKKIYPTDDPVTVDVLNQWYEQNPEFGLVFEEDGDIKGMCITMPLTKTGWTKLTAGELLESELDHTTLFNPEKDTEIGIHCYHIERFHEEKGFYKECLEALQKIVTKHNATVIGFSGLCVTESGIGLFADKLQCKEKTFISQEHILKNKDGELIVFEGEDVTTELSKGFEHVSRCQMLVLTPDKKSLVWDYLQ